MMTIMKTEMALTTGQHQQQPATMETKERRTANKTLETKERRTLNKIADKRRDERRQLRTRRGRIPFLQPAHENITAERFQRCNGQSARREVLFPPTQLTNKGIVDTIKYIYGRVMTQMSAKQGIKEFGQEAVAALMQEFAQLENLNVYEAMDVKLLTRAQRRGELRAINLIKKKRDGKLKGRTVADGSV